jgi:hypothetical protein
MDIKIKIFTQLQYQCQHLKYSNFKSDNITININQIDKFKDLKNKISILIGNNLDEYEFIYYGTKLKDTDIIYNMIMPHRPEINLVEKNIYNYELT